MSLSRELQIGKAGEHLVCCDLIIQGFNAFLTDQGLPYDIIVDTSMGIKRIQVKTTQKIRDYPKSKDVYRFSLRSGKGASRRTLTTKVDVIACVALDSKKIGYFQTKEILNKNGKIITLLELRDKDKQYTGRIYSNGTKRNRFGRFIDDHTTFSYQ